MPGTRIAGGVGGERGTAAGGAGGEVANGNGRTTRSGRRARAGRGTARGAPVLGASGGGVGGGDGGAYTTRCLAYAISVLFAAVER